MAARSTKAAARKPVAEKAGAKQGTAKKADPALPGKAPAPAENAGVVPTEVISEVPDLLTPEIASEIMEAECLLDGVEGLQEVALVKGIKRYSGRASDYSRKAVRAGAHALVCAWTCGKLLNAARDGIAWGEFGSWLKQNIDDWGMSKRTAYRYMRLAEDYRDVRVLLEGNTGLRQAYIACGILPDASGREEGPQDGGEPESDSGTEAAGAQEIQAEGRYAFLAGVTTIQRNLRALSGFKGKLDNAEKTQLSLVRKEINGFFDSILS